MCACGCALLVCVCPVCRRIGGTGIRAGLTLSRRDESQSQKRRWIVFGACVVVPRSETTAWSGAASSIGSRMEGWEDVSVQGSCDDLWCVGGRE